eukprot:scaffold421244_cov58-Attheya_sp.AAC.8
MAEKDKSETPPSKSAATSDDATPETPVIPPVEAACKRLERLLGHSEASTATTTVFFNPSKVVRKWLGTSSGAAGAATLSDVSSAALKLLDPEGPCAAGLALLSELSEEDTSMDVSDSDANANASASASTPTPTPVSVVYLSAAAREAEAWLISLAVRLLWKTENANGAAPKALTLAHKGVAIVEGHLTASTSASATLFPLLARLYRFQSLTASDDYSSHLRPAIVHAHRMSCLRRDVDTQATLLNIMLHDLLNVSQVQLLMGEIPERSVFDTEGMVNELAPYMKITQAVRRGDLAVFGETVQEHAERLKADYTFTLISRLEHSVVKAGLRRLNMSYSRISLADVADRLGLPNASSAEFVVAKAVRDGVIDATIDHAGGYVQSHDLVDVYATTEPAEAFHRRIAYCLTTHNDAVRGMRYPPDAYKKQLEASRGMEEDDIIDEEKAQELEDEYDEDF